MDYHNRSTNPSQAILRRDITPEEAERLIQDAIMRDLDSDRPVGAHKVMADLYARMHNVALHYQTQVERYTEQAADLDLAMDSARHLVDEMITSPALAEQPALHAALIGIKAALT